MSADGTMVAYAAHDFATNAASIGFDPDAGVTEGEERTIVAGTRGCSPMSRLTARSRRSGPLARGKTSMLSTAMAPGCGRSRPMPPWIALARWLPDGRSLVFYSTRSGGYQFWSVNRDGSGLHPLTHAPDTTFNYPVPSPDGRRLYFTSGSTGADVWLMHVVKPAS